MRRPLLTKPLNTSERERFSPLQDQHKKNLGQETIFRKGVNGSKLKSQFTIC